MPDKDEMPMRCQSREARSEACVDYLRELVSQANLFDNGPDPPRSALGRPRPPNGKFLIKLLLETGPDPPRAGRGFQIIAFLIKLLTETGPDPPRARRGLPVVGF